MKKIVGTILAAGLALSAFAAEPAANFVLSEFKGDAGFGFGANFVPTNAEFGMFNSMSASIKFGLITEGTRETTGDGIWGDLQIKFADGLNWEGVDNAGSVTGKLEGNEVKGSVTGLPSLKKPTVEVAKIHFVDGDFSAALNILAPGLTYDGYGPMMATPAGIKGAGIGKDLAGKQGFGLEVAMDKLFALNFKFVDNGLKAASAKKFGLAFDVDLRAVPNLTAKAMGSFNFDLNYMGFGTELGYSLAITDALYVQPGLSFTFANEKDTNEMMLAAGLMFGWGAKDCEPGLKFINNKTNEGVSVAVSTNMKENGLKLAVGAYDQSLFSLLGLTDFGTLNLGAEYVFAQGDTDTLAVAAKYHIDLSPVYFDLNSGIQLKMPETGDSTTGYAVTVKLGSKEIIDNTDVYVSYDIAGGASITTNALNIGTLIQF